LIPGLDHLGWNEAAGTFQREIHCDIMEFMVFPIKTCVVCGEEFELRPGKPGFANRCPECSEPEDAAGPGKPADPDAMKGDSGLNAERRRVMRDLLYRKDS
jgi:hypothetical protein